MMMKRQIVHDIFILLIVLHHKMILMAFLVIVFLKQESSILVYGYNQVCDGLSHILCTLLFK